MPLIAETMAEVGPEAGEKDIREEALALLKLRDIHKTRYTSMVLAVDLLQMREDHSHETTSTTLARNLDVTEPNQTYPQIAPETDYLTETERTDDDLHLQQSELVADEGGWIDVTTSMPDLLLYQTETEMEMATTRSLPGDIPAMCMTAHQKLDSQTVCLDSAATYNCYCSGDCSDNCSSDNTIYTTAYTIF